MIDELRNRALTELYQPMPGRCFLYVSGSEADVSILGRRRPDVRVLYGIYIRAVNRFFLIAINRMIVMS